jgi:hypothetical protein
MKRLASLLAVSTFISLSLFAQPNATTKKMTSTASKISSGDNSVATSLPVSQTTLSGAKTKSLEQRLLDLEERQREFEQWYTDFYLQSKDRVTPFLGEKISLGGFFETGITYLEGPDMTSQVSANSEILGINLAADFTERIKFVTQYLVATAFTLQNVNNNPGLAAPNPPQRQYGQVVIASLVAHAYLEYRQSEAAVIQTGIGYVPFGIAMQEREPVLFKRRNGPQMLAAGDAASVGIAFPLWLGVNLSGAVPAGKGRVGYNLYTFSPTSNAKTLGGGTRLWWSDSQLLTLGISAQTADQGALGTYYSYGTDANLELERGGVLAEYARNVPTGQKAIESYYLEPYYNLADGEWVVYVAADYINNPIHTVGAVADPYEVWRYGGGVNWLPIPNTRFRIGYLWNDYLHNTDMIAGQRRDYYSVDFSAGVAF